MMLAILEGNGEVLICEVDSVGQPKFADYFPSDDPNSRNIEDYDVRLVEAPIQVTRGPLRVDVVGL